MGYYVTWIAYNRPDLLVCSLMAIEIPLTAKAAVLNEIGNGYVLVEDYPVKQPSELAPGECLIKLDYSGVCHSDIHIQRGTWPVSPELPVVGGHEGVGHVVAIGEHSTASIKIGDRVGVKWIGRVCAKCVSSIWILDAHNPEIELIAARCVAMAMTQVRASSTRYLLMLQC